MCGLDCACQVEELPHVNVAVERSGVREVVFGGRHTQDGLQVARLPKDPPLWSESVSTQGPELPTETEGDA